jgi:FkbM family methyltransferase
MRKELLYNPRLLLERLAEASRRRRRFSRLRGTPAEGLNEAQMDSLEFFDLIRNDVPPKVIFDVGANAGTWTRLARTFFPESEIHAFEPLPEYQAKFESRTEGLKGVRLHKAGAGEKSARAVMNLAGHSSSFLEIGPELTRIHPTEFKRGEQTVQMVSLDDYASEQRIPLPDLMKLDVEGYELQALRGATKCMQHCRYLVLEVSFVERHIGQPLFHEVAAFLGDHGFFVEALPVNAPLGRTLTSMDVLFRKKS